MRTALKWQAIYGEGTKPAPSGVIYLIDEIGNFLIDEDGKYLILETPI